MNKLIELVDEMCAQSLSIELFENWETIKNELCKMRRNCKNIKDITDEDAQEVGYDSAVSFIESNKDYLDGIGLLTAKSFMYLLSKNYDL